MSKNLNNNFITCDSQSILDYLQRSGMINVDDVMENMKKEEIIKAHPYKIYQGADGRWYTYVPDEEKPNKRKKVVKRTEEQLNQALYDYYQGREEKNSLANATLQSLYPMWKEYKALHTNADASITRFESEWKKHYLGKEIANIPIRKLDKLTLDTWAHTLIKDYDMTSTKYYNATLIMRQMLTYAVDMGIIEANPMDRVKIDGKRLFRKDTKKSSESQVYSNVEFAQVQELAWKDFHNRTKRYQLAPLAVLFMFYSGVRIGEVLTLRYEDIGKDRQLHVRRMFARDSKQIIDHTKGTYGDRTVILPNEAFEIIENAQKRQRELGVDDQGYIFSINGQPPSYHSVSDLYRKYCDKIGIDRKSSHKARKTYVSNLLAGGVGLNTVREQVGHTDEKTTLGSYCFDIDTKDERQKKIQKVFSTMGGSDRAS